MNVTVICASTKTMAVFSQAKTAHITWRLHERRGRLQEHIELRKKVLAASYHMQLQNDRNAIQSHINHLQPGLRRAFLQQRLVKINAQFKQ
jgi:hypothetical protein